MVSDLFSIYFIHTFSYKSVSLLILSFDFKADGRKIPSTEKQNTNNTKMYTFTLIFTNIFKIIFRKFAFLFCAFFIPSVFNK